MTNTQCLVMLVLMLGWVPTVSLQAQESELVDLLVNEEIEQAIALGTGGAGTPESPPVATVRPPMMQEHVNMPEPKPGNHAPAVIREKPVNSANPTPAQASEANELTTEIASTIVLDTAMQQADDNKEKSKSAQPNNSQIPTQPKHLQK